MPAPWMDMIVRVRASKLAGPVLRHVPGRVPRLVEIEERDRELSIEPLGERLPPLRAGTASRQLENINQKRESDVIGRLPGWLVS